MASHFSILPSDIIQYLSLSLDTKTEAANQKPLRILRLPHPRTGLPASFLPLEWLPSAWRDASSQSTLLEIQGVSPPDERSWMLGEDIISDGSLFIMTPIDPTFLLLHILRATQPTDLAGAQFRTTDDLFDESAKSIASQTNSDQTSGVEVQDILDFCALNCTRKSLMRLCDVKEISSEIVVYRPSLQRFTEYMRAKVAHLEKCAAVEGSRTLIRSLAKDGLMEDGNEEVLQLGRTRACCDLVSQYLSADTRDLLVNSYDFTKLQKHIDANMREAIATNTAPSKSKAGAKSTTVDKKRKPVKASRGIENLKKANTTGMAKLSSFFGKA